MNLFGRPIFGWWLPFIGFRSYAADPETNYLITSEEAEQLGTVAVRSAFTVEWLNWRGVYSQFKN